MFLCGQIRVDVCNNRCGICSPPERNPIQFNGLVDVLRVVTRGRETVIPDEEILHIDRVTRFDSDVTSSFVESTPYFKFVVDTA